MCLTPVSIAFSQKSVCWTYFDGLSDNLKSKNRLVTFVGDFLSLSLWSFDNFGLIVLHGTSAAACVKKFEATLS